MEAIFEWDRVLSLDPPALRNLKKDKVDMIVDMFISTKEWDIEGKAPNKIIHIFKVFQALLQIKNYEVCETQSLLEKVGEEQVKTEVKLLAKVEMLEQRLQRYSAAERSQHVADLETDELKEQLESEQAELIKSIGKIDREKSKRKQLARELQEADTKISMLKQEVRQYEQTISETEEEVKKLQREIKRLRAANLDLKDSFRIYGDDLNAKSGQLLKSNKKELEECSDKLQETESKNKELQNDKVRLINLLQESEMERERIILKLNYVKGQILETDQTLDWLRTEKDAAEDKFRNLKKDIYSMTEKFDEIAADASERVQECKKMLHEKEHVIFEQQRIIFELKHDLQLAKIDLTDSSVGVLHQAIEDRDKTIDVLCEKVEHYTKRIEKNVQAFEQQETKGKKGKVICFLESQLKDAEQRANNAEQALYQAKVMIKEKNKEVWKVSDILRNYTAGTYGLNSAFKDLERWKHKMKVKASDMEPLTTAFNHLEMRVKDLMEENLDVKNMQKEGHAKEFYIPKGHRRLKPKEEDDKTEQPTRDLGARHKTKHLERHNPAESQLDKDGQWQSVLNSFTDTSSNTDEEPRPGQFLQNEISNLSKEMEIVKRKLDRFQKIWDNFSPVQRERAVSRANIGSGSTGMPFAPKQTSSFEMEESNERQRAADGSKFMTTSLSTLKERNAALESQVKELTKIHLDDKRVEQQLRSELANRNHRGVSETNSGRIPELERSESELRMKVFELQGKCCSFNEKILSLKQESNIAQEERKQAEDGRMRAEEKAEELKFKNAELEKAVAKLKDKKAAQDANAERQEACLQEMKKREMDNNKIMDVQKDEISLLRSLVKKKEQTIHSLEENQLVLQEACQLAEGKLQEELKQNQQKYRKIHTELLNCVAAFEGDAILPQQVPVVEQVMYALGKFKEHLSSTLATHKHLEEKLKEKEDALKKAEHKILSSDRVINDLRLELSSLSRQQLQADQAVAQELASLSKAKETMNNLQLQLERKDEVIKKNTERFTRSLNERNESINKYQNELAELQHKLNLEMHTGQRYKNEIEKMKQEINSFNSKLDVQMALRTECLNEKAELQNKLAKKEIELETVNKDLLELRQEYEDISSKLSRESASQKRELHFMQQLAEREAEEFKVQVKYLKDKLQAAEKTIIEFRRNEDSMRNKMKDLIQEIEFFQKRQKVIEDEKGMYRRESRRLTLQLRRLSTVPLKQLQQSTGGPTVEELQAKIRVLEGEFEYRLKTKTEVNKEMIEFRMRKTWQKRLENLETSLKQKEEENESLLKRQSTLRNLLEKLEKEKRALQDKLKPQAYRKQSQM
ncbi:PREDICTED: centrosomal protein of 290 kDa-like [Poecilia mexicana]|uniref:centrosomal protein of 290 kDa-like n=1 Tax=Poecilia mexicana TaxID=48701 RepID=UPI00072DA59E|nr:PREDICTED: centrosomal protein of 290 kDa-like [Poecilia mexicana]